MTVPFLNVRPKAIRLKVSPRFPSKLIGGAGIEVTKANGNYTLDLNYDDFPQIGALPANATYALIYDPTTKTYVQAPISLLGIPEAPTDGQSYARRGSDKSWQVVTGAVASVFGRTGVVTAQNNDYTFSQIGSKPTTLSGYGIIDAWPLALTSTGVSANFNAITTDGHYFTPDAAATNTPTAGHFWYLDVYSTNPTQFVRQIATQYEAGTGLTFIRLMIAGVWQPWVATRERLVADKTIYVRNDGDDTNNGNNNTGGATGSGAFKTFQAAYNYAVANYDFNGKQLTVMAGVPGQTFEGLTLRQPWTGGGSIIFDLNGSTIDAAATSECLAWNCTLPGQITLQNATLSNAFGSLVHGNGVGTCLIKSGMNFGAANVGAGGSHIVADAPGAVVRVQAPVLISGSAYMHVGAISGGQVFEAAQTHTITANISMGLAFAYVDRIGFLYGQSIQFKGSQSFTVTIASPAVITTGAAHGLSAGSSFFPNTTGALPTGLVAGQRYFVLATGLTPTSFQVSLTAGGAAVNTSGSQSGTHNWFSVTGTRHAVSANGVLYCLTGPNTYPGSVDASAPTNGGQFI